MSALTRKRLSVVCIASVACILALFVVFRAWETRDRQEMLSVTQDWARLAPLPATARDFTISNEGSIFTRGFHASFTAPVADVERWLQESPGTRYVTLERRAPSIRHYLISPGEGAMHAEVMFDESSGEDRIYTYWS